LLRLRLAYDGQFRLSGRAGLRAIGLDRSGRRLLALDTTSAQCAVALLSEDQIKASKTEPMTKGQAERLFPMTDEVLEEAGMIYKDLDAIAVAIGPGNFTGVRVCVAGARGLSLSLGIPAIGISTLEALGYGQSGKVLATIDARAEHLYAQIFDETQMPHAPKHIKIEDLPQMVSGIETCCGFMADKLAIELGATHFDASHPGPEVFAQIAMRRNWAEEERPSPLYLRQPDAALPTEPIPHIIR